MQIVIDKENLIKMFAVVLYAISGGSYDNAKDTVTELLEEIGYASLPKGHGRLIDADEIQFENTEFDTYGDYSRAFDAIDQADTIIEVDKEREE